MFWRYCSFYRKAAEDRLCLPTSLAGTKTMFKNPLFSYTVVGSTATKASMSRLSSQAVLQGPVQVYGK